MGYGAFLTITNHRSRPVRLRVDWIQCMVGYDWIDEINRARLGPSTSFPSSGGRYLEADASGSCWISNSTFNVHVAVDDGGGGWTGDIGVACFQELYNKWSNANTDAARVAHVTIENSHPQAKLTVDIVEG